MKILLDEDLPHQLRHLLTEHDVFTTAFMKWDGTRNGSLLAKAASEAFEVLITMDKGFEHQQNLMTLPCSILLLRAKSNSIDDLGPLLPKLREILISMLPRSFAVLT